MKNLYLIIFLIPFLACKKSERQNTSNLQIKTFTYQESKAPIFFQELVSNHYKDFNAIDNSDFEDFCSKNNISTDDNLTSKKFYTLKILHELFTSKNASNGSKGEILNIPYFWHWVTPNPRHEIIDLKTNQKLVNIKPPKEFSKYKSKADIDRTPYLFLSELLNEQSLYSMKHSGDFSTFGWCSEREMAFVCLLNTMNYSGKVITSDNHSWSEFIVPMKNKNNQTINYKVKIDNTFDSIEWSVISKNQIIAWDKQVFQGQGNWYNKKALSQIEKQNVTTISVSPISAKYIEEKVVSYLKER